MIKRLAICLALLNVIAASLLAIPAPPVTIKLGPPLEIGRAELLFGSGASVCEDDAANFYVLNQREQTVFKFSPDGRQLMKFGRKGQGPGDFLSPGQRLPGHGGAPRNSPFRLGRRDVFFPRRRGRKRLSGQAALLVLAPPSSGPI